VRVHVVFTLVTIFVCHMSRSASPLLELEEASSFCWASVNHAAVARYQAVGLSVFFQDDVTYHA
jgi:hypothetical protein